MRMTTFALAITLSACGYDSSEKNPHSLQPMSDEAIEAAVKRCHSLDLRAAIDRDFGRPRIVYRVRCQDWDRPPVRVTVGR